MPGIRLERFYHHIFQTDVDIQALMADLGLGDRIMWRPGVDGRPIDSPADRDEKPSRGLMTSDRTAVCGFAAPSASSRAALVPTARLVTLIEGAVNAIAQ